jgi:radical SAM/Cys-rich protein
MTDFERKILETRSGPLSADGIRIMQLNLGYICNMSCKHCHIEAGPSRREVMGRETIDHALKAVQKCGIETLDLTGGAPELNPFFRSVVKEAKALNLHVIARSNLTVFFEDGYADLPEFYAENRIEVIASLPHYTEDGVDRVRGSGTFLKSVEGVRKLNDLGYGSHTERKIHLVYNPLGAFLPSSQNELENQYRSELHTKFGISFDRLYTFANLPIGRFRDFLTRSGNLEKYMETVKGAFNPGTLDGLMCRYLISVRWDGKLYDCDFNQVLGLTVDKACPQHIEDFDYAALAGRKIVTDDHCFVCTAGQGSS